jgi:hypothetical protein
MDYKNGKIYKITDNAYTKMYIGSTTQSLSKRFSRHKSDYKLWLEGTHHKVSIFNIFDEFGIENCKIELIENYECNSKNELERKEGEHIKNNDCVNKVIAGRTKKEYYNDNKNKILEKAKEYKEANKNKILEKKKEHYEANKQQILNIKKIRVVCECGKEYTKGNKSKHIITKKHIKYIETEI